MDKHLVAGGFLIGLALTASVLWCIEQAKFDGRTLPIAPQTQAAAPAKVGAQPEPVANVPAPAGPVARAPQTQPSTPSAAETPLRQPVPPQPKQNISQRLAEPTIEPAARRAIERVGAHPAVNELRYAAINDRTSGPVSGRI
jgi:hypothetical protein